MYSFLFLASHNGCDVEKILKKSKDVIESELPSLNCTINSKEFFMPEINGGYYFLYPEQIKENHLITDYNDDEVSVLVFGDTLKAGNREPAEFIAEIWKKGGIKEVRQVDGCFSAIISERKSRKISIISDLMGLRTFNYFSSDSILAVSIHDAAIVSTGLCPLDYDLPAIISLLSCDWSIQGIPLLKQIRSCHPMNYVEWNSGKLSVIHSPILSVENRLESGDRIRVKKHIESMIEVMRENARFLTKDEKAISLELTAGMDSRAVLGILLNTSNKNIIRAETGGATNSLDVHVAKKLSRKYGFSHYDYIPSPDESGFFVDHLRILAFVSNGIANSKRAARKLPELQIEAIPSFIGNGGEVYHGYYYTKSLQYSGENQYSLDQIFEHLKKKILFRCSKYNWKYRELVQYCYDRLLQSIISLQSISKIPSDIFNLFYLYERYCRWGSRPFRNTWTRKRYSLFSSTELLKLAFKLPAPISQNYLLHRSIIKSCIPEVYYWPVNSKYFMPAFDYPLLSRACTFALEKPGKYLHKFLSEKHKTHESLLGDIFSKQLASLIRDTLYSDGTITSSMFDELELRNIVESHIGQTQDNMQIIGFMMTVESYKQIMESVFRKIKSK